MRAFKQTDTKNYERVLEIYPMFRSSYMKDEDNYWDEYPGLQYACVSIWDHWLYLSDNAHLIEEASTETISEWKDKFRNLNNLIVDNTEVILVSFGKKIRFKEIRCKNEVKKRLDPDYPKGFFLLIPKLKIIYISSDEHSSISYHQSEEGSKVFDGWVKKCGLKYVQEYVPSMKKNLEKNT